jgi:hypothetical protein
MGACKVETLNMRNAVPFLSHLQRGARCLEHPGPASPVRSTDFAQAWGILDAEELVHGEFYATAEAIEGLGKITAKGEAAIRE